jgi:hypothetical protein
MPCFREQTQGAPSIFQYWDTEVIPDYVADLMATFRDRNPDFEHRVYSEVEAERFIGEHFGSREAAAFKACAVPSMQSDYFRYCSVLALGGVYADADYECIGPVREFFDQLDRGEIFLGPRPLTFKGRKETHIWSAFFAFREAGHPFLRLALDIATANLEARISERIWPEGKGTIKGIWLTVGPGIPTLMHYIHEWGSLVAFDEAAKGTAAEPFAELYLEVIGDYDRIVEAFDGVRVSPCEELLSWVADPEEPLPYKQTDLHWHNVTTAIFRER